MHLSDLLQSYDINFENERKRIELLFARTPCGSSFDFGGYTSIKEYLARDFLNSKLRATFISIDDFIGHFSRHWKTPSLEGLLFYCEVIINLLRIADHPYGDIKELMNSVARNISIIIQRTGYELRKADNGLLSIVKKNALAITVIEDIDESVAAKAILEYNRLDMKGNLEGKRKLLKQIGDFIEPTLQKRNELSGQLYELADDVSFCLNNLNIRHNNKEGKHKKDCLNTMSDKDLEVLYDDAYRTALLLIELSKQEESHKRIGAVRQQSKGTK